jgi:hypothetical protein
VLEKGDRPTQLSCQQKPEEPRRGQEVSGGTRKGNTEQRLHQIWTHSDRMGHGERGHNGTDRTPTGAVSGVRGGSGGPLLVESSS